MQQRRHRMPAGLLLALLPLHAALADVCDWRDDFDNNGLSGPGYALTRFDDGRGTALYVAGEFHQAGGNPAQRIARWDGMQWETLGGGLPDEAYALTVFDDGSGAALYAAGRLTDVGAGTTGGYVMRWDGNAWQTLGPGFESGAVRALGVYDDGSGAALYAGGDFTAVDGVQVRRLARWSGSAWSEYGGGITCEPVTGACNVRSLRAMPWYGPPQLFVGGRFTHAGGIAMNNANGDPGSQYLSWGHIGRWDGTRWFKLNGGLDREVRAIAAFDDIANASQLRVAGLFDRGLSNNVFLGKVGYYAFAQFSRLRDGLNGAGVYALDSIDAGDGARLYAAGNLQLAPSTQPGIPDVAVRNITRWNGISWEPLGAGLFGDTFAITGYDDGSGAALYASGFFTSAGGVASQRIAKWQCVSDELFGDGFEQPAP